MRRNAGENSERDKVKKMIKNGRTGVREMIYC
jgi:hypothetical protein